LNTQVPPHVLQYSQHMTATMGMSIIPLPVFTSRRRESKNQMDKGMARAERIRRMEELYFQRAWSDIEMAERLGVDRTTVYRDRIELERQAPFAPDQDGRWRIDRTKYLSSIRVNSAEALSLYLPARRMSQQTRLAQADVASALGKLAITLRHPMTERLVSAADEILRRKADPQRAQVFQAVARAWIEGLSMRLDYRNPNTGTVKTHRFEPYLLEPSPWSDGVYLIGHSDIARGVITLKLERIEDVHLLGPFTPPADFDEQAMLRHAWGIWGSNEQPVKVRLRFAPGLAARRLKESVWHPLETVTDMPDGGCIWEAEIAEWREMLPWVRGWGADVEVLEPEEMRRELTATSSALSSLYRVEQTKVTDAHRWLWAKADRKSKQIHRLVYHMIDVGLVAYSLWESGLQPSLKRELSDWLRLESEEAGRLIAFISSLHDLGKASPAFQDHTYLEQSLRQRIHRELRMVGFTLPQRGPGARHTRHEVISTWSLRSGRGEALLSKLASLDATLADSVAQALGGHHGCWPVDYLFDFTRLTPADKGDDRWAPARAELVSEMLRVFNPPALSSFSVETERDNVMLTMLSAIVSVADWIGSDEEHFPLEDQHLPIASYLRHARHHAECALDRVGWARPWAMASFSFERVFPFAPSAAQQEVITEVQRLALPALVIVEAPMGVGKTEAALATYALWAEHVDATGLYIAMPTTATSNQMHSRTEQFLTRQLGQSVRPLLVHSRSLLQAPLSDAEPVEEQGGAGDAAAAQAWFLPHKKSLLAPYGVGTVDQALMSVLQTKHFFVRLFGLSHKVIIFDEVHAYDAYMSELFTQLLRWLRAVGTSVVILSATLPDGTRRMLLSAYGAQEFPDLPSYPRLTAVDCSGTVTAAPLTAPPSSVLNVSWIAREKEAIVEQLSALLHNGGCAAVICNTVARAQEVFEAIHRSLPGICSADNLLLFHARFPQAWRDEIEQQVLEKFGKGPEPGKPNPKRPLRAVVVATQVIEQSLDLDFDIMISDLAPADLLLQRAGRLHRHAVNGPARGVHPYLLRIAEPPVTDGVPQFDSGDTHVYPEYLLLRSWLALQERAPNGIRFPAAIPELVEAVYGSDEAAALDLSPLLRERLLRAREVMQHEDESERRKAQRRRVLPPDNADLLFDDNLELLDEDDPSMYRAMRALTRSGDPGVNTVCLHRIGGRLHLEPEVASTSYDPIVEHIPDLVRDLALRAVTIRHVRIQEYLLASPAEEEARVILARWKRIPGLRYHRVLIFDDGVCRLPGTPYMLVLKKVSQLGLQILEEGR
jgi:CRISPR-associated endonuclease/helicase Cas3